MALPRTLPPVCIRFLSYTAKPGLSLFPSSPMFPSQFKTVPTGSVLAQLLSKHDDSLRRGFITRLDHSPVSLKRKTFFKALALNLFILFAVLALIAAMTTQTFWSPLSTPFKMAISVTHNILIGSAIVVVVRSTIVPFFLGECRLRLCYGFRPSEIVIRRPPTTLSTVDMTALSKEKNMERSWRMAARAVNPNFLYSNAGAIFSSEFWTLEYAAIFDALRLISQGELSQDALEFSIFKQRDQRWGVWELWRMHELMSDQQEVSVFKSLLVQSGKGELAELWQGIKQTRAKKTHNRTPTIAAYQLLVDKFAQEGLDYESVWSQASVKH